MENWLVVSTPLKHISQLGWLFPIYGKIKHVPNHQSENMFQNHPPNQLPLVFPSKSQTSISLASAKQRRQPTAARHIRPPEVRGGHVCRLVVRTPVPRISKVYTLRYIMTFLLSFKEKKREVHRFYTLWETSIQLQKWWKVTMYCR